MTRLLRLAMMVSLVALAARPVTLAHAQEGAFPLPAPLYILTSQHDLIYVDPANGGQTVLSSPGQPVADFDIAPDGEWLVYRTPANNLVVVAQLAGQSGYVLEFADESPPASGPAQTIAWSPDAGRIAYTVPGGVRIAELGAGEFGTPLFSTVQGPWIEIYWADPLTLIASDASGNATRISGTQGAWTLAAAPDAPARPQPPVPSYLATAGVVRDGNVVVPGTAGALAFDWGPFPLPLLAAPDGVIALPADLTFLAADATGVTQVWRLARAGGPAQALTASAAPVIGYGLAPSGDRLAYVSRGALAVARLDGAEQRSLAALEGDARPSHPAWSPDGARLAYHDGRGLWVAAADGSSPPRLVAQNVPFAENVSPGDVRVYFDPQWSPDGTRLLVGVGFWEGMTFAALDAGTGAELFMATAIAGGADWADDGRVLTWASSWGYQTPGLFLLDPTAPAETPPRELLASGTAVLDVRRSEAGVWYALVATSAEIGPQYLRVLAAPALEGRYAPLAVGAGGFASAPQLGVAGQGEPLVVAGLRALIYDESGHATGNLTLLDMITGQAVQVQTAGPVSDVRWAGR
ncbi:MAG: hypothetical protein OZ934_03660 [Anaerolineae bacterium]|nr:hypothetical protein [Anaerolineae bacterium]